MRAGSVDSKGCNTSDGGFPVAAITDSDNYHKLIECVAGSCETGSASFDAPGTAKRSVTLGVLSGIPNRTLGKLSKPEGCGQAGGGWPARCRSAH